MGYFHAAVVVKAINFTEESAAFICNVVTEDAYRSSSMTLVTTKLHGVTRRSHTVSNLGNPRYRLFHYDGVRRVGRTLQIDVSSSAFSNIHGLCRRINSIKSPASGAGNVSEPRRVGRTLQTDVSSSAFSLIHGLCRRINSIKSPASGAGNVSEPRLMSQVGTVREVVCAWISECLQSERWRCQYWSAYVAAAVTSLM